LWGDAAPVSSRSMPSAARAEQQATSDAKVNARVKELVGRACDGGNWQKALTEAGKARGADARRDLEAIIKQREQEARGGYSTPEGY
jgi:Skp family chaperone for outer membrane proteins